MRFALADRDRPENVRHQTDFASGVLIVSAVSVPMPELITERVRQLRQEIAEIIEANHRYAGGRKSPSGADADKQRRAERLQAIMDELHGLTDWKRP